MPAISVRNLSEETHRALKRRAMRNGRSTEAEVRDILEDAVRPKERMKLGSALAEIGRKAGGVDLAIDRFRMIVLDTNVVSEPLRSRPDPKVLDWLDRQDGETLFLTTISLGELRYGIAVLPAGRRKDGLSLALDAEILPLFGERILCFDRAAAEAYARIRAAAKSSDRAIAAADGFIAAIAAAHGFAIASRDREPFDAAGLHVHNPWQ